jgi:nitrous oxidase accessory protein NosD
MGEVWNARVGKQELPVAHNLRGNVWSFRGAHKMRRAGVREASFGADQFLKLLIQELGCIQVGKR